MRDREFIPVFLVGVIIIFGLGVSYGESKEEPKVCSPTIVEHHYHHYHYYRIEYEPEIVIIPENATESIYIELPEFIFNASRSRVAYDG